MGYTNYWQQFNDFTVQEWSSIKGFLSFMIDEPNNYPIISITADDSDVIQFNGDNRDTRVMHEDFTLHRECPSLQERYQSCKTNRKPYDIVVWSLLMYCKARIADKQKFMIRNDAGLQCIESKIYFNKVNEAKNAKIVTK